MMKHAKPETWSTRVRDDILMRLYADSTPAPLRGARRDAEPRPAFPATDRR